ncbi:MAG: DUF3857 domain-containing protein, partial [Calditrichia bacterium]|nr:DUF3857 domain-containing protein [Calditrichia bacterium]
MKNIHYYLIYVVILLCNMATAGEKFKWDPITDADWLISENEQKGMQNAVMIFEKILADDEDLIDEKCYYTIYRRIRILNEEGRSWGDVSVPFVQRDQRIDEIKGRTILPGDAIIPLSRSKVLEKEIFKSKEIKIRQKSFYLPAVSNNCIIEYMIKLRLKSPKNLWRIEKNIYLLKGEFVWKFFRGEGLSDSQYNDLSEFITPNYIWLNTKKPLTVDYRPSIKRPEEVIFTISDVKGFEDEPFTLPESALKANLRTYYGGGGAPGAFWGDKSKNKDESIRNFTNKNNKILDIVNQFRNLATPDEKIIAAYDWVQNNLTNINYEDDTEDYDENKNVNDVLKHGYGTGEEINMVFYDLLREMNLDAKMTYVTDRDESIFENKAKYWQFDRSLVAYRNNLNAAFTYYSPCLKFLPCESVPWYNEGVVAFLIGSSHQQFCNTPFSRSHSNLLKRHINLKINKNFQLSGSIIETHRGHSARRIRLGLYDEDVREQNNYLKNWVEHNFIGIEPDSFEVKGIEETGKSLIIKYQIEAYAPWYTSCNKILIQPFHYFSYQDNEFHARRRKYPIIFDYSKEIIETFALELPAEWEIVSLPEDVSMSNKIGSCEA